MYYEKSHDKSSSESALSDCMITDINKIMGESGCASQHFVSNYFDHNVDIKDAIRKFSFPYLRRCALLWKILYSSIPAPFCDEGNMSNRPLIIPRDTMGSADINMFEIIKIQELENMFKIPPLDVVLKDELSRSSVSIWCRHFCKEFESQRIQRNIHVTPAVPFRLMKLPNVYQDLLQRYFNYYILCVVSYMILYYYFMLLTTTCIHTGVSNSAALSANHILMILQCAYCAVDCAPQAGNHAAGSFLPFFYGFTTYAKKSI